ncbi:DUF7010 family protein [Clostridium sp. FP2]|uniref:DUF7010 family protein n=1 Tax=Clostridium sp. FP2 TaxID=2724481 RepID=UPI00398C923B
MENKIIIFFTAITGAHLLPYGWLHDTKFYMKMAPLISILITIIGWNISLLYLWCIPLSMLVSVIILNVWICLDYKQKNICKNL